MKIAEILAVLSTAILSIILSTKWEDTNWIEKLLLITGIIASILVAINAYRQDVKDKLLKKINDKFGDIHDLDGAALTKLQLGNKEKENDQAIIDLKNGLFGSYAVGTLIKMYVKNEKLFIDTIIRDISGEPIAVIDGNTWTVYNDDYEYNNDQTSFELVTKGERKVYFQLSLKNGIAQLSGHLINDKGHGFLIFTAKGQDAAGLAFFTSKEDYNKIINNSDIVIPPIFKYPREKYYSKTVD